MLDVIVVLSPFILFVGALILLSRVVDNKRLRRPSRDFLNEELSAGFGKSEFLLMRRVPTYLDPIFSVCDVDNIEIGRITYKKGWDTHISTSDGCEFEVRGEPYFVKQYV
jgi:hypothetical protein